MPIEQSILAELAVTASRVKQPLSALRRVRDEVAERVVVMREEKRLLRADVLTKFRSLTDEVDKMRDEALQCIDVWASTLETQASGTADLVRRGEDLHRQTTAATAPWSSTSPASEQQQQGQQTQQEQQVRSTPCGSVSWCCGGLCCGCACMIAVQLARSRTREHSLRATGCHCRASGAMVL